MNNMTNPEDYKPLQYRISKKMIQKDASKEMMKVFQNALNAVLSEENMVLSKNEQLHLSKSVLEELFIDIRKRV
jgi:hypothetical protein